MCFVAWGEMISFAQDSEASSLHVAVVMIL